MTANSPADLYSHAAEMVYASLLPLSQHAWVGLDTVQWLQSESNCRFKAGEPQRFECQEKGRNVAVARSMASLLYTRLNSPWGSYLDQQKAQADLSSDQVRAIEEKIARQIATYIEDTKLVCYYYSPIVALEILAYRYQNLALQPETAMAVNALLLPSYSSGFSSTEQSAQRLNQQSRLLLYDYAVAKLSRQAESTQPLLDHEDLHQLQIILEIAKQDLIYPGAGCSCQLSELQAWRQRNLAVAIKSGYFVVSL